MNLKDHGIQTTPKIRIRHLERWNFICIKGMVFLWLPAHILDRHPKHIFIMFITLTTNLLKLGHTYIMAWEIKCKEKKRTSLLSTTCLYFFFFLYVFHCIRYVFDTVEKHNHQWLHMGDTAFVCLHSQPPSRRRCAGHYQGYKECCETVFKQLAL